MNTKESRFHFERYYIESPQRYGDIFLYQIGDRLCRGGVEIASHVQVCHEISCVVSGTGFMYAGGEAFRVRQGDLFLSPLGTVHRIRSSVHDPLRYSYCGFMLDPASSTGEYAGLMEFFAQPPQPLAPDRSGSVRQVFSLLLNELLADSPSAGLLVKNGLELLFLLTRRCYERTGARPKEPRQSGSFRQRMVYDVVNYIDNHILGIHRLTDISDQLGYSYSYVSQSFAAVMGSSLSSYYQQRRFEKAVELLSQANTVTQVSEALGFDSVQSFSRFFRKSCGAPPSRYMQSACPAGPQPEKPG